MQKIKETVTTMELVREAGLAMATASKLLKGNNHPKVFSGYIKAAELIASRTQMTPQEALWAIMGGSEKEVQHGS
jgi:hypothetical protein